MMIFIHTMSPLIMKVMLKVYSALCRQLNKTSFKDYKGYSLVELLLVILLIFIIVALVSVVLIGSENASRDVINIVKSEMDARLALYRISKDIRETHKIISASNSEVIFESNIDVDEYYETVRYYLEADESHYDLYRQIDSGVGRLYIENIVDGNMFTYYTGLSTPEGGMTVPITDEDTLNTIKYIKIDINIDQSGSPSLRTMALDTLIALRNRMY